MGLSQQSCIVDMLNGATHKSLAELLDPGGSAMLVDEVQDLNRRFNSARAKRRWPVRCFVGLALLLVLSLQFLYPLASLLVWQ